MKIYTRTGDEGETGLYGSGKVPKDSLRIAAIGDVDELNAALGVAAIHLGQSLQEPLREVQRRLFDVGAELATVDRPPPSSVSQADIDWLEISIDEMTAVLPPLRAFILPGGSAAAAGLHFARAVCRRAERSILSLHHREQVRREVRVYLNRLSDWLFTVARTANAVQSVPEIEWQAKEQPAGRT